MTAASPYFLEVNDSEIARLRRQNEAVGEESAALLDAIGVGHGWRVADLGCGPMGLLETLSDRVGPAGKVVGLDVNELMLQKARELIAATGRGNVELRCADAAETGLPRASFDLVHERLLLINVPHPTAIVQEMMALAKPGGVVALEDIDGAAWACDPPHPAWDRLYGAFYEVFRRRGGDPHMGRRLPRLLREAGAVDIEVRVRSRIHEVGHVWRHLLLQFTELTRAQAVAEGLLDAAELNRLRAELTAHLDSPSTTVLAPVLIQVTGRKPA